jgi:SAM-dependent methyltransferase
MIDQKRLNYEAAFHNDLVQRKTRQKLGKITMIFYEQVADYAKNSINLKDKAVLDYGCGEGKTTESFLESGVKHITGIDIAENVIRTAQKRITDSRANFKVMNAELLDFTNESFDIVFGSGILQHLNIRNALLEVDRVLKNKGVAVFIEPLGHNPFINLYRRKTPHIRTPYEHPLTTKDLNLMSSMFNVKVKCFHLTSLLLLPIRRILPKHRFTGLLSLLMKFDSLLFKLGLWKYGWIIVITLKKRGDISTPSRPGDFTASRKMVILK